MRPVVSLFQISRPVAGSSAAILPSPVVTYIIPLAIVGLNAVGCPAPVWYSQATSSWLTLSLLIWVSAENCEKSAPPR